MTIHPLARRGAPRTVTWTERLATSQTEGEVVAAVREYLALLSLEEVGTLPESCRPVKIVDGADVSDYAFELIRHRGQDVDVSDRIHRIAVVVSLAATRISALQAAHPSRFQHTPSRQPA